MNAKRMTCGFGLAALAVLALTGLALGQSPLEKGLVNLDKLVSELKVSNVVGAPIQVGETTVIPFARVSFGMGGGGFGGGMGGGMGAKTVPLGVLIIEGNDVRAELFEEEPPKPSFLDELRKLMADKIVLGNGINIAGSPGVFEEMLPKLQEMLKGMTIIGNGVNVAGSQAPGATKPEAKPGAPAAPGKAAVSAPGAKAGAAAAAMAPSTLPPSMAGMQKLYDAKNYTDALAMSDALLAKDPNNAELHAWKGDIMGSLATGDPGNMIKYGMGAMQEFETALSIDPNNVRARIGRAISRLMAPPGFGGDIDGAITDLEAANAKAPSAIAYYYLGEAYRRKMLNDKAKEAYTQALKLQPNYPEAKNALEALK